ncbi:MAG: pknD 1 [Cyanobacteria bacterium RYN_339]|nr:pknD 1 [Cyanobacteria bacterium RYN_339]
MTHRHLPLALAACLVLAACKMPVANPNTPPKARASEVPATTATAQPAPAATAPPGLAPGAFLLSDQGGGLIASGGGNVLSNNGAGAVPTTLSGRVSLVTDNGSGIIGSGGGNIIGSGGGNIVGNNAGGFHLLAATGYAGAYVYVLDADGVPLKGADGLPAVSRTDADGRYAFTGQLPAGSNYLVAVSLPGGRGQLGAIAPKGAERHADLDLASTLATVYVLDRYVRPQAGHQTVLDKLPPELEATTRQAMAAALVLMPPVLPQLTAAAIVQAVDALRTAAKPLDTQLEAVKALLVAGQSDLGAGKPATEVALPWIRGVVSAPGGGFWLNAALSGRVFYVDPAGKLTTYAGNAAGVDAGSLAGKPAAAAGFGTIQGLLPDGPDRLLIVEQKRLTRREADGTLTELWPAGATQLYAVGRADAGAYWLLAAAGLHRVAPGAAPTLVRPTDPADAGFLKLVSAFGQDAQGRLVLYSNATPHGPVRRYDPAAGKYEELVALNAAAVRGATVDAAGRIYLQGADGAIRLREDGQDRPLLPAEAGVVLPFAYMDLTPAGDVLWALLGTVNQVTGAQKHLVAGRQGVAVDADGQVALNRPGGLLVEPDGALVLAVAGDNQVVRLRNGVPTVLAGTGASGATGDGGPATAGLLANPTALRRDALGAIYVLQAGRSVRRLGPDGNITTVWAISGDLPDRRAYDFAITQDSRWLYVTGANVTSGGSPKDGYVTRVELATGVETPILTPEVSTGFTHVIALDAQERLHVMSQGALRRWDGTSAFTAVATDAKLATTLKWSALARAAFDPQGRFWWFSGDAAGQLNRLEGGQAVTIAGPGGKFLTGNGVDDSLLNGMSPVFTANGDVLFCDTGHNQVKRLPGASAAP